MPEPKVSIIIPAYNAEKYISSCLDMALRQTYEQIEIICVDDGSTDRTAQILADYAQNHPQLRTITFSRRQGTLKARCAAVEAAAGEYILFCDADDYLDLETVRTVYFEIQKRSCSALMFGFNVISATEAENKKYAQSSRNIFTEKLRQPELTEFYFSMDHPSRGTLCGWCFQSQVVKAACRMMPEVFCCVNEDAIVLFVILTLCESADGIDDKLYTYQRMIGITGKSDTFADAAAFLENYHTSSSILQTLLPELEQSSENPAIIRQAYRNFVKKHHRYMCLRRLKRPGMTEEEHLMLTRSFFEHSTPEDFADAVVYRQLTAPSYSKLNLLANSGLLPTVPLKAKKIKTAAIAFGELPESMVQHLRDVITAFRQLKITPVLISDHPQNGDVFDGLPVLQINAKEPLKRMEELSCILNSQAVDLYYSNTENALADSLVCRLIVRIPVILHIHGSFAQEIADKFDFSWYRNAERKFCDLLLTSNLESEAFYRMNGMPALCHPAETSDSRRLENWKTLFNLLKRDPGKFLSLKYSCEVARSMLDILRLQTIDGLTGKIQISKTEAAKTKKLLDKETEKSLKLAGKCKRLEKKLARIRTITDPEAEK